MFFFIQTLFLVCFIVIELGYWAALKLYISKQITAAYLLFGMIKYPIDPMGRGQE